MTQVVAVVGPTASGKTSFGIALAEALETEILSADSMQFYRGLEIGTGQPTGEELARVKHHFVGSLDLSEETSAGRYREQALPIVERLNAEGKPAVVVGGSGLYIRALLDGLFSSPPKDEAVRAELEAAARDAGPEAMHARLREVDPVSAERIAANDVKKVLRALEVFEVTGEPISALHETEALQQRPLKAVQIGIEWARETLYERINRRVDTMLEAGWLDEVKQLVDAGRLPELEQLRPIGYLEIAQYLRGQLEYGETVETIKMMTRRYAKRQLTWFRKDQRIRWVAGTALENETFHLEQLIDDV